jgi:low temperature requirement protein LtrA
MGSDFGRGRPAHGRRPLGGQLQTVFFASALVVDWGGIYLTSREGNWRIHSAPHWTERHGLFIILAIGESVVAIGVGAAGQPISTPLLAAGVLGVAAALCLWWLYFDVVSRAAEHRLRDAQGQARVRMASEGYTYGHFPIVAGIIVGAVGVEGVLAHAGEGEPLGLFYAAALYGGFALYLAGHLLFKQRMYAALSVARLVTVGVLLLALPAAAPPPMKAPKMTSDPWTSCLPTSAQEGSATEQPPPPGASVRPPEASYDASCMTPWNSSWHRSHSATKSKILSSP